MVNLFFDFSQQASFDLIFSPLHFLILLSGLENMNDLFCETFSIAVAAYNRFFYHTPIAGFGKVPKCNSQLREKFFDQPVLKGDIETQGGCFAVAYKIKERSVPGCVRQKILDGPGEQFNR